MPKISKQVIPRTDLNTAVNTIQKSLNDLTDQLNNLSNGGIKAASNTASAPPTSTIRQYFQGDYLRNDTPVVLGAAGSRYVIKGWICVAGGSPGTWVDDQGKTGT